MYDSIINADTTAFLTIGFSIAAIIGTRALEILCHSGSM